MGNNRARGPRNPAHAGFCLQGPYASGEPGRNRKPDSWTAYEPEGAIRRRLQPRV